MAPDKQYLVAKSISKRFRATVVLEDLDLVIGRGEFVSLLGPSGCGKTTLLRLVAGLLQSDTGSISLGGRVISDLPPHRRNVGVVFQNYALFPHLSVYDNVAFGLRARGLPESEIGATVARFLDLVRMASFADRYPAALSGGQQQRIAVARALAPHPDILLLDEPFSALDRNLREGMQVELRALLRDLGITAVFVTHDQDEALVMSDRIAVMHDGVIEQFDTPGAVYRAPKSQFVLGFIGASSRLAGTVTGQEGDEVVIATGNTVIRAEGSYLTGAAVVAAVRPEDVFIAAEPPSDPMLNAVKVMLADRIYIGARTIAHFTTDNGERLSAELAPDIADRLAGEQSLYASWGRGKTMIFPAQA